MLGLKPQIMDADRIPRQSSSSVTGIGTLSMVGSGNISVQSSGSCLSENDHHHQVVSIDLQPIRPPSGSQEQEESLANCINDRLDLDYICEQIRENMKTRDYQMGGISNLKLVFQTKINTAPKLPPIFNKKPSAGASSIFRGLSTTQSLSPASSSSSEEIERIRVDRDELKKRLRESCSEVDRMRSKIQSLQARKETPDAIPIEEDDDIDDLLKSCSSSDTETSESPAAVAVLSMDASEIRRTALEILRNASGDEDSDSEDSTTIVEGVDARQDEQTPPLIVVPIEEGAIEIVSKPPQQEPPVLIPIGKAMVQDTTTRDPDRSVLAAAGSKPVADQRYQLRQLETLRRERGNLKRMLAEHIVEIRSLTKTVREHTHKQKDLQSQTERLSQEKTRLEETVVDQQAEIESLTQQLSVQSGESSPLHPSSIQDHGDEDSLLSSLESLQGNQEPQDDKPPLSSTQPITANSQQQAQQPDQQDPAKPLLEPEKRDTANEVVSKLDSVLVQPPESSNNLGSKEEKDRYTVDRDDMLLKSLLDGDDESFLNDSDSNNSYSIIEQCELAWMQQAQEIQEIQKQQDAVLARLRASSTEDEDKEEKEIDETDGMRKETLTNHQEINQTALSLVHDTSPTLGYGSDKCLVDCVQDLQESLCGTSILDQVGPAKWSAPQMLMQAQLEDDGKTNCQPSAGSTSRSAFDSNAQSHLEWETEQKDTSPKRKGRRVSFSDQVTECPAKTNEVDAEKEALSVTCEELLKQLQQTKQECQEQKAKIVQLEEEKAALFTELNDQKVFCLSQETSQSKWNKEKIALSLTCEDLMKELHEATQCNQEQQSTVERLEEEKARLVRDINQQTMMLENAHTVSAQQRETINCLLRERQSVERVLDDHRVREKDLLADAVAQRKTIANLQDVKDSLTNRLLQKEETFQNLLIEHIEAQNKVSMSESKGPLESSGSGMPDENLNIAEVSFQTHTTDGTSFEEEQDKEEQEQEVVAEEDEKEPGYYSILPDTSFCTSADKEEEGKVTEPHHSTTLQHASLCASTGQAEEEGGTKFGLKNGLADTSVCASMDHSSSPENEDEAMDLLPAKDGKLDAQDVLQLMSFALPEGTLGKGTEATVDTDCEEASSSMTAAVVDEVTEASKGDKLDALAVLRLLSFGN